MNSKEILASLEESSAKINELAAKMFTIEITEDNDGELARQARGEGYQAVTTPETVRALVEERNKAHARELDLRQRIVELETYWEREKVDREKAEADAARLRELDNPEFDATEAAHPAWWRGHNHTAKMFEQ